MNSNFMKHGQHHQQQHLNNTENNHFYFSQQSHQQFQPHYNLHQPVSYPGSYNIQPRSFPDPRYQTSDLHSYNQELYHNGNTPLPPQTYYQHPLPDTYYSRYPVFEQQNGSERKFGTPSQVSAAASFFARNRQPGLRVNARLDSLSPSVDQQRSTLEADENREEFGTNFRAIVSRAAPSLPQSLIRRIESGEGCGVGKVRVILRVASRGRGGDQESESFRVDKKKKQVTLFNPGCIGKTEIDIEDRQIGVAAPKMFAFDEVFSSEDSQEDVSCAGLSEVLAAVLSGSDGCLFCYGHSRLGKSWTMIGDDMAAANIGTIPLAISWLFRGIKERRTASGARFSVRVSAMEIRGQREEVTDLLERYSLDPEQSREAQRGGPGFLSSLSELRASSAERAAYYLDAALHERSKDPGTGRESHFIFSLYVYQYNLDKSGKGGVVGGRSRLHLIDFGDCDRARVTGGGITMAGLGNVILGIFNGQKHLPCRDSRVTSVLRECLGGVTCHAAMMAHVSSDPCHYSETLHTVQLASRVHRMRRKRDRVKTRVTSQSGGSEDRVARLRSGGSSSEVTTTTDPSSSEMSCDTVLYRPNSDGSGTDGESPGPALSRGSSQESIISRSSGGRRRRRVLTNGALTPVRRRSASPLCLPSIDEGLERMPLHGRVPVHRQRDARVESPAQTEANKINNNNSSTSLKADMVSKWLVGQSYQHLDWPIEDNGPLFLTKFKTEEDEEVEETVACLPAVREKRKPPRPPVRKTPPRVKEEVTTVSESPEPLQDPSQSSLEPVTMSQTDNCLASKTIANNCQVQISNSSTGFAPLDTEAAIGDHPLRILSEENLTVVSTFVADVNDLGDIDDNDDEIDPSQFSFFTVPDFYKDSSDENPCNRYFESSLKSFENTTNDNIYRSKETTASENQIQHSDFVTKIDDASPTLSDPRYLFANYKEMSSFCGNIQPQTAGPGLSQTVSAETQFLMLSQSLRQTQETEKLDTSLNDSPSSLENIDSSILDNYDAMNFNNQNDVSRDLNKNVTKTKENEITFASKLMKFFKINRSKKKRSKSYDKELDRGLDETSRSSSLSPLDGLSRTEKSMAHVDICVTPVSCLSLDQTEWEYQGQTEDCGGEARTGKPGGGGDRKSSGYDSLEGEESSSLESSHDIFENFLMFSPPGKMDVANGNVGTVKYAVPRDNSDLNYDNISNYDEISALRKDIRRSSNTRTKF